MKNENVKLMLGDNIEKLRELPDNFVDSIITDPPYGLSFMGKKWDYDVPSIDFWKEALRVLKPGGHVLSFGGTRTYHRMVVNMEDAGFEIRDQIMWVYGSGFPKSHNIGKAVDKIEGNEREVVGKRGVGYNDSEVYGNGGGDDNVEFLGSYELENGLRKDTKGQSKYEGWGTALKPANEPICVARKPLSEKSVALNVIKWGTGGINIDGCRVEGAYGSGQNEVIEGKEAGQMYHRHENGMEGNNYKQKIMVSNPEGRFPANIILDETAAELLDEQSGIVNRGSCLNSPICVARKPLSEKTIGENVLKHGTGGINIDGCRIEFVDEVSIKISGDKKHLQKWKEIDGRTPRNIDEIENTPYENTKGRFPANLIFDETAAELLDEQSGDSKSQGGKGKATQKSLDRTDIGYGFKEIDNAAGLGGYGDTGGASRFFYVAKVSKKERNMGLDLLETKITPNSLGALGRKSLEGRLEDKDNPIISKNNHPTIKPINLLTYLVRLITPPNGIVMDCYMGSGSTGIAALLEGFQFIGMEMDEDYFNIAEARIDSWEQYKDLIKKK